MNTTPITELWTIKDWSGQIKGLTHEFSFHEREDQITVGTIITMVDKVSITQSFNIDGDLSHTRMHINASDYRVRKEGTGLGALFDWFINEVVAVADNGVF